MSQPRRRKHEGSVYARPHSSVLWLKYGYNGRVYRESAETTDRQVALKRLRLRLAEVAVGKFTPPSDRRLRVGDLYQDVELDYKFNGRRTLVDLQIRWRNHLEPFFGPIPAVDVSTALVKRYIEKRIDDGARNGTINRELAVLKRCYKLGTMHTPPKVRYVPHFPMLKEDNIRTGFLAMEEHDALGAACRKLGGLWMETIFEAGYTCGWRSKELKKLQVNQVEILSPARGVIRLEPFTTKNNEGREVPIGGHLLELVRECIRDKKADEFLLTRPSGRQVIRFDRRWKKALLMAGITRHVVFHDLRRTAARNLRRAGVPQELIMRIGGWKTDIVFRRYAIVDHSDLAVAMAKLEENEARIRADRETLMRGDHAKGSKVRFSSAPKNRAQFGHNLKKRAQSTSVNATGLVVDKTFTSRMLVGKLKHTGA